MQKIDGKSSKICFPHTLNFCKCWSTFSNDFDWSLEVKSQISCYYTFKIMQGLIKSFRYVHHRTLLGFCIYIFFASTKLKEYVMHFVIHVFRKPSFLYVYFCILGHFLLGSVKIQLYFEKTSYTLSKKIVKNGISFLLDK